MYKFIPRFDLIAYMPQSRTNQFKKIRTAYYTGSIVFLPIAILCAVFTKSILPHHLGSVTGILLVLVCFICSITDIKWHRILNSITYPTFLWLLILNFISVFSPNNVAMFIGSVGFIWSILGGICCFMVSIIPYHISQGGAGDVKLAVVIGAGMGVSDGILTLCITFVFAGLFGISWAICTRGPIFVAKTFVRRFLSFIFPMFYFSDQEEKKLLKEPIPLAPCFFLATLGMLSGYWQKLLGISV